MGNSQIAIHTLASAAMGILKDLSFNNNAGFTQLLESCVKQEHLKLYRKIINSAANFFKHADKDPDDIYKFNEETNDMLLLHCVMGYENIIGNVTPVMNLSSNWMMIINPDLIQECDFKDSIIRGMKNYEISNVKLKRDDQLIVLKKLIENKGRTP